MSEPLPFAWIAGVIDARGHIESHNRHGHVQPRVRVTTKDTALLDTLARFCGNKVVLDERGYRRKPCGDHCLEQHSHVVRQSASWTVDSARATVVLYNVVPLMFAKRVDASLALEAGLQRYPPARGDLPVQMRALGWVLPEVQDVLGDVADGGEDEAEGERDDEDGRAGAGDMDDGDLAHL